MEKLKKIKPVLWEIGKWGIVLWLIWPIKNSMIKRMDFSRIVFGVLLFVIFAGKMFYDIVLKDYIDHSEKSNLSAVLALVAMVSFVALLIGAILVFFGVFVFSKMNELNITD